MIKPNLTIVEMILKARVDVNGQDLVGDTALHNLMRTDQPPLERIVNRLIDLGAQVDIANSVGDTPLHVAVRHGRWFICQMLLAAGADPRRRNYDGHIPLAMMERRSLSISPAQSREIKHTQLARIAFSISIH